MTNEEFRKKFIGKNLTGQKDEGPKVKKSVTKVYQSNFGMFNAKPGDMIPVDDVTEYITGVDPFTNPMLHATTAMSQLHMDADQMRAMTELARQQAEQMRPMWTAIRSQSILGNVTPTTGAPRIGGFFTQRVPDPEPETWRHKIARVLDWVCGIPKESKL